MNRVQTEKTISTQTSAGSHTQLPLRAKQESTCPSAQRTMNCGLWLKGEGGSSQNNTALCFMSIQISFSISCLGSQMFANRTQRFSPAVLFEPYVRSNNINACKTKKELLWDNAQTSLKAQMGSNVGVKHVEYNKALARQIQLNRI